MVKRIVILFCLLYLVNNSFAQHDSLQHAGINSKRMLIVSGANAAFYTGSFIALHKAWYNDFEKTGFHFFNDNPEWNQMDKAGHVWSTYHITRLSAETWKWTGMKRNQAAVAGAVSGLVYQSIIEIQDAYSAAWGFSWGDVGANVAGAGLYVMQDALWQDQRIQVKLGYNPYDYPGDLTNRRNQLFGKSPAERLLKDYNSQTYWLTGNLSSFFTESKIPPWLNVAVGYSAGGMYGGRENYWLNKEGTPFDYRHIPRVRRFYLSPDIQLSAIKIKSKVVKTMFFVLSAVRIPMPAVEFSQGKLTGVIR